jgi:uncharacterized protein YidB (DUF937 family)
MGLLDGLVGGALGQIMGGSQQGGGLAKIALGMLMGQQGQVGGGLGGLLQQLQGAGLGDQVKSWVGNGPNMPVSAEQIMAALGQGQVQQVAQQLGVQPQQAAGGLAAMLPELINHLTPNGAVPPQNDLSGMLGSLMKQIGH